MSMHTKYEVSASFGSDFKANVNVDNRQTDIHTNKQANKQTGQNNWFSITRSGDITLQLF